MNPIRQINDYDREIEKHLKEIQKEINKVTEKTHDLFKSTCTYLIQSNSTSEISELISHLHETADDTSEIKNIKEKLNRLDCFYKTPLYQKSNRSLTKITRILKTIKRGTDSIIPSINDDQQFRDVETVRLVAKNAMRLINKRINPYFLNYF